MSVSYTHLDVYKRQLQTPEKVLISSTGIFNCLFGHILMNLVVDLLYKVADPRISLTKGGD